LTARPCAPADSSSSPVNIANKITKDDRERARARTRRACRSERFGEPEFRRVTEGARYSFSPSRLCPLEIGQCPLVALFFPYRKRCKGRIRPVRQTVRQSPLFAHCCRPLRRLCVDADACGARRFDELLHLLGFVRRGFGSRRTAAEFADLSPSGDIAPDCRMNLRPGRGRAC
jgi:hypothetical protein